MLVYYYYYYYYYYFHTLYQPTCLSGCTVLWVSGKVPETQHEISPVHAVTSMWIHLLNETPEKSDNDTRWTIRGLILGTVYVILFFLTPKVALGSVSPLLDGYRG